MKEALQKRPDIKQEEYMLKNDDIEVRATKNSLLPSLSAFGQYSSTGVGGNATVAHVYILRRATLRTFPRPWSTQVAIPSWWGSGLQAVLAFIAAVPIFPLPSRQAGWATRSVRCSANDFPTYEGGHHPDSAAFETARRRQTTLRQRWPRDKQRFSTRSCKTRCL